jgi:hypothetical protein
MIKRSYILRFILRISAVSSLCYLSLLRELESERHYVLFEIQSCILPSYNTV